MMLRTDIFEVLKSLNSKNAVSVVKHDYTPSDTVKYLNNVQYVYPRKNWSSFVVWNCAHLKNKFQIPHFKFQKKEKIKNSFGEKINCDNELMFLSQQTFGTFPSHHNTYLSTYLLPFQFFYRLAHFRRNDTQQPLYYNI